MSSPSPAATRDAAACWAQTIKRLQLIGLGDRRLKPRPETAVCRGQDGMIEDVPAEPHAQRAGPRHLPQHMESAMECEVGSVPKPVCAFCQNILRDNAIVPQFEDFFSEDLYSWKETLSSTNIPVDEADYESEG